VICALLKFYSVTPETMPAHVSSSSSSATESIHELDLREDKEWEDAEADEEKINVMCLFGEKSFGNVNAMLEHCRFVHDCDIVQVQKELGVYVSVRNLDPGKDSH
jgi:hypothetical protein